MDPRPAPAVLTRTLVVCVGISFLTVSYTHLTLTTNREV